MSIAKEEEIQIAKFGIQRAQSYLRVVDVLDGSTKLSVDDPVQRQAGVWDITKRTKFIDSILKDMYVPSICVQEFEDGTLNIIDGKQRITTVLDFVNGDYALSDKAKPIDVITKSKEHVQVDIKGKKFNELPERFQRKINTYSFHLEVMQMDNETKNEVFARLNNGVSLKTIEIVKVNMSVEFLNWLKEIKRHDIFTKGVPEGTNIDAPAIEERVLQGLLTLIHKGQTGLGKKELEKLSKTGITEEQSQLFGEIVNYLDEVINHIPKKKLLKLLQKSKSASLFRVTDIALMRKVDSQVFAEWAFRFFIEDYTKGGTDGYKFKEQTLSSVARIDKVSKRNEIAVENFKKFLDDYNKSDSESEIAVTVE